jgi:hypothetical protein
MKICQLAPQDLPGLAQAWEAALGRRFPTAEQLVAPTREPRLVRAVVAGDEIVAAALADLTRKDGVRVARISLLASFLGDEELDRRLKCALVVSLQATFRRFQAKRLEIWTDQDDDLARMILRRLGCPPTPGELRTGPDEPVPHLRPVRSSSGEGSSVRAFSCAKASVTVTVNFT